jgi:DNA-binding IclR family transcriptional regulator
MLKSTPTASAPATVPARRAGGIQSVGKAFDVLRALAAADGPVRLSQLAAATGLSASLLRAYLLILQAEGAVNQHADTGQYDLGITTLHLGMAALRKIDVTALARPAMDTLCEQLHEPVSLTVWGDGAPLIVHNVAHPHSFPYELKLGSKAYATTTAAGRCFLAHMDAPARDSVIEREQAELGNEAVPRKRLLAHLARVREVGIAERQLVLAVREDVPPRQISIIAAPVLGSSGDVKAAITVLSQSRSFDPSPGAAAARALLACARHLSAQLGYVPPPHEEPR